MSLLRGAAAVFFGLVIAGCAPEETAPPEPPRVPALTSEAGFLDLPATESGPIEAGKMFYSFRPVEAEAGPAPLVVFFNGGPGWSTSGGLMAFGTGPMTLDAWSEAPLVARPNPASWTRFANLLYLDSRDAGFSYEIGSARCARAARDVELFDAGDFAFALLDFLDAHPALVAAPVVFAGESYGGARAVVLARLLIDSRLPPDPMAANGLSVDARVPGLLARIDAHVAAATAADPGFDLVAQFHHAVLIEPAFSSEELSFESRRPPRSPIKDADPYDDRHTKAEADAQYDATSAALVDPDTLEALLGVDLASIRGLAADERRDATRRTSTAGDYTPGDESELRARLGALGKGDAYWLPQSLVCAFSVDQASGELAYGTLSSLELFMTRARFDLVVDTDRWPAFVRSVGATATVLSNQPAGAARPGVLEIGVEGASFGIRFPEYEAGHEVAKTAAPELAADVEDWLVERGLVRGQGR